MSMTRNGFTLVELLIAMAISGVIMTGVYSAFKTQQDSYLAQDQVAEMQQNIRAGFYLMASDVRMAGYDPDDTGNYGVESATSSKFVFTADLNDDGGAVGSGERFTYELYTTGTGISALRKIAGQSAVAENIEQLEFYYTLADGTQTTFSTAAATATQLEDIRAVEISILAMTGHPDRNYTNTQSYTSASGADWTPATADNFRRRFQTMTVKCRNMGL